MRLSSAGIRHNVGKELLGMQGRLDMATCSSGDLEVSGPAHASFGLEGSSFLVGGSLLQGKLFDCQVCVPMSVSWLTFDAFFEY